MENKGLYINELPQSGEVTFLAVVIEKELRPKRNGGSFLAVRFADRGGELDGKVWDNPEAVAQLFDCDNVVKVRGTIDHYNDKPQLIVSRIRRCDASEYSAGDFYPASSRDPEEMVGELRTFISMVREEALRQLLESIVNDAAINERLRVAPAANADSPLFSKWTPRTHTLNLQLERRSSRTLPPLESRLAHRGSHPA
jgi:3'-5' exoribonuclease